MANFTRSFEWKQKLPEWKKGCIIHQCILTEKGMQKVWEMQDDWVMDTMIVSELIPYNQKKKVSIPNDELVKAHYTCWSADTKGCIC